MLNHIIEFFLKNKILIKPVTIVTRGILSIAFFWNKSRIKNPGHFGNQLCNEMLNSFPILNVFPYKWALVNIAGHIGEKLVPIECAAAQINYLEIE